MMTYTKTMESLNMKKTEWRIRGKGEVIFEGISLRGQRDE